MPRTRYFKEKYVYQDFVQMVRDKLDRQKKTQIELATCLGVTPATMCRLLNTDRQLYMDWHEIYLTFEFLSFTPAERLKVFGIRKETSEEENN